LVKTPELVHSTYSVQYDRVMGMSGDREY